MSVMNGLPIFSPRTLRLLAAGLVVINGFFRRCGSCSPR